MPFPPQNKVMQVEVACIHQTIVCLKLAVALPVFHSFTLPQAAVIFPSNYFPFYSAPRLTMMDNRLKKRTFSLRSVCVGLTQAHTLFLPQTSGPWKDCVPLCFSHSNTIHFVFIFSCLGHFFCDIWLKHIAETKV